MRKFKLLRAIAFTVFSAVFVLSFFKILLYFDERQQADDLYTNIASQVVAETEVIPPQEAETAEVQTFIEVDFESLLAQCNDVVGWIYLPDSPINYPVMQGEDNNEYLNKMLNGKYNSAGSIFADYRNSVISAELNYIIYGHNMKNDSMFGTLTDYRNQNYFDEHPTIYYFTPEKAYEIRLFAGFVTDTNSTVFKTEHNEQTMDELVRYAKKNSTFTSPIGYTKGDTIVTLSTCTNVNEEERYVLLGILYETIL